MHTFIRKDNILKEINLIQEDSSFKAKEIKKEVLLHYAYVTMQWERLSIT